MPGSGGGVQTAVSHAKHLVCRYDRFRRIVNTIKSKPKKGTYNFNCLATANCIVAGSRAFLAARLVRRGDADLEVVSGLMADCRKQGIMIKSLKIDREFFSVDIMDMLEREGIPFMVPAIKTKGVKKAVKEFEDGWRKAVSRHSIDSGRDTAEFTLIIQKKKNGHFTPATNATVPQVLGFESGSLTGAHGFAEQYRLRWGVEAAYKDYESLRPRTTSRNESVRMLLLFFPIFIYNAWALVRYMLRTSFHGGHMTLVEHTIGRLKRYARLADPYDGNAAGFNREFSVITGLVNLNIVGLHGKGSATAGAVEDVSRLGQGLLRSSGQVEFRAR